MLHIEASITVAAPQPRVIALYRDYASWPRIFPTIDAVRLVRTDGRSQTLAIRHREGLVRNVMTPLAADVIELKEWKKRYTATFINRFEALPGGTRFTLAANITLKRRYRLLAPFLQRYIRRQMIRFVLEPIRAAATAPDVTVSAQAAGRRTRARVPRRYQSWKDQADG